MGVAQGTAVEHGLGADAPPGLVWAFAAGATGAFVALPLVLWAVHTSRSLSRRAASVLHVAAAALFSFTAIAVARTIALALGAPRVPPLLAMVMFDLQNTLPLYAGLAFAYATHSAQQRRRAAERELASLREQVIQEQLWAASARLQPVRMFAALRAARSALPHSPAECDAHIQRLADALRRPSAAAHESSSPGTDAASASVPPELELPSPIPPWAGYLFALPLIASAALLLARAMTFALPAHAELIYVGSLGRAIGVWSALPLAYAAVRLAHGRSRLAQATFYCLGFCTFSAVWVSAAGCVRGWLSEAMRLAIPHLSWHAGFLLELQRLSFVYAALCGAQVAWRGLRDSHARERSREQLRGVLAESRLQTLNARVDPHFLFNALNTLSSFANTDVERTARLIDTLHELLEVALSSDAPDWPLRDEQLYIRRFVEFLSARFGERVRVDIALPEALLDLRVPRLSLQTLVENAVKHNQDRRRPLRVCLSARIARGVALLTVSDDGKGFSPTRANDPARGALERLRRTLQLLYGSRAALSTSMCEPLGACIEISIPLRTERSC
ncbi:MAG: yehU [Myxococcaceae bacterium]|nr:yehU [Myxococcaceae bacterium]